MVYRWFLKTQNRYIVIRMVRSITIDDNHMQNLNNLRYNSVSYQIKKTKAVAKWKKRIAIRYSNIENTFFIKIYRNIYEETCRTNVSHEVDVTRVKQTSNIMKAQASVHEANNTCLKWGRQTEFFSSSFYEMTRRSDVHFSFFTYW